MSGEVPTDNVEYGVEDNIHHGQTLRVNNVAEAYPKLVTDLHAFGDVVNPRNEPTRELRNIAVHAQNPRKRMFFRPGFNLAFCLQECFAYWNGLNPGYVDRYNTNMKMFMSDGKLNGSAYGDRLRNTIHDQIDRILDQLSRSESTRRAVAVIHQPDQEQYTDGIDVACTLYLHFIVRDGKLHVTSNMRSQDIYWGYTYDVVAFQWLQEVIAGILDLDLGTFTHQMNSLHYYEDREEDVLNSPNFASPDTCPDCRVDEATLNDIMEDLGSVLTLARNGQDTRAPNWWPAFYRDWAHVMIGYEMVRFHDKSDIAESLVQEIEQDQWANWLENKL